MVLIYRNVIAIPAFFVKKPLTNSLKPCNIADKPRPNGGAGFVASMLSALAFQVTVGGVSAYDVLWGAVFGFASLNILGLLARRFEPGRTRMTLGEAVAIGVAVVSLLLLGWELLFTFHVLPIHLQPR